MANSNTLSAYRICWIEFRAINGIVTKKDGGILSGSSILHTIGKQRYHVPFASKELAMAHLDSINPAKLGKKYEVRLFTDKQFGLAKSEELNGRWETVIPFTQKQEREMRTI